MVDIIQFNYRQYVVRRDVYGTHRADTDLLTTNCNHQ